MKEEHSFFPMK